MIRPLLLLPLAALAACGPAPLRIASPAPVAVERVAVDYATIEVLDVSIPEYAADELIFVQVRGGALTPVAGAVWADDPARALTLDLSLALAGITGARVAPEPWPFVEPPEALVDVRLAEVVADASGAFLLRGQYFVASREETEGDRAEEFRIAIPLPPEPGPAAIAAARAQATLALAHEIARNGLR